MSSSRKHEVGSEVLTYRLRVSRRRRTVALAVGDRGELVVYAPWGVAREALEGVIAKNRAWIAKKQAERREAWALLQAGKVYYRGEACTLRLVSLGPADVRLAGGVLLVSPGPDPGDLWLQLLAWYRREAEAILTARVKHFASRMGLAAPPVEVRDWRRRWGECHSGGRLRFNWRLVLLSPEILDYVVVHELAHLKVAGHPPRFWQEVGQYLPDYAARRRWLNRQGAPFLSWRLAQNQPTI